MPVRVRTGREAGESSGDRCMRRGWRAGKGGKWLDLATVPGSARRGAPHTCLVLPCLVRYLHQLHLLAPWLSGLSPHQYCMRHAVSGRDLTTHAAATHAAAVDPCSVAYCAARRRRPSMSLWGSIHGDKSKNINDRPGSLRSGGRGTQ